MATHSDRCHSLFRAAVLPHFPHAEGRFKRHFKESCDLIRRLKPRLERRESVSRQIISLNQAFTFLGAKPLMSCDDVNEIPQFRVRELREAGLDVYAESKSGIMGYDIITGKPRELPLRMVYDPALLAPILSEVFNTKVTPEDVRKTIRKYKKEIVKSAKLLGYPEQVPVTKKGRVSEYRLDVGSFDEPPGMAPSRYHAFGMQCLVSSPNFVYPKLTGLAFAAALVEEIRQSPPNITSRAAIFHNTTNWTRSDMPVSQVIVYRLIDGTWISVISAPPQSSFDS